MKVRILGHEIDVDKVGYESTLALIAIGLTAEHKIAAANAQELVKTIAGICTAANPDTKRLDKLRKACGYVENGSNTSVTIGQDDATRGWVIAGGGRDRGYSDFSLRDAIDKMEIEDDHS